MMKNNRLLFSFVLLSFLICYQSFSQNTTQKGPHTPEIPCYLQVPEIDSLTAMREHIVLQLANEQISNNQLFFKAYLLTGPLQNRYSNSNVLHIELQDNEGTTIKKQFHKIENGMATGNLTFPKRIKEGTYTVKAYTQWMRNFSDIPFTQKQVQIGDFTDTQIATENRVTITPEGGTFLQKHKNKIVFQIPPQLVSKDGYIGTVIDSQGKAITKVKAYGADIGVAFVEPEKDQDYFLTLTNNTSFPFPESQDEGYLIQINNLDPLVANIQVIRAEKSVKTPLKLVGMLRGIPYFEKNISFSKNSAIIQLDKEKIPKGILELRVLDQDGVQLAKRPLWIDGAPLQITWDQITSTNEEMIYRVKVTDQNNIPVKTQVAVSVIQEEKTHTTSENTDLFTAIGSQSDAIANDRNRRFLKDMYVLTSSSNTSNGTSERMSSQEKVKFPIQKGLEITGYAYDLNNTLLNNTTIQVIFTNQNEVWVEDTTTDRDGILRLKNLQINGETNIVFRTQGEDTKSRLVILDEILAYNTASTNTKDTEYIEDTDRKRIEDIKEKAKKAIKKSEKELVTNPFDTTGTLVLNDVPISGKKAKEKVEENPSLYGIKPAKSRIVYQDFDRPKEILQLLEEMSSILINRGNIFNPTVSIFGTEGPVLFVVDGVPLPQGNGTPGGTLISPSFSPLNTLLASVGNSDVQRIELLLGPDAAIFGSRASGGVIAVYTRFASGESISRKKAQLDFQGYESAISFEEYQKSLSKREQKNDPVVYWNPSVETDENGEAIIKLPISSANMPLKVKATTINKKGNIGVLNTALE